MQAKDFSKQKSNGLHTLDYTPGSFPPRLNTVQSDILAMLLESKIISGMEAVFIQNTTRLAAFVHAIESKYGWKIERRDMAVGTKDGRVAWITTYWLHQETIARAFDAGAREWIDGVKLARAACRKEAPAAMISAAWVNSVLKSPHKKNPHQGSLWSEE